MTSTSMECWGAAVADVNCPLPKPLDIAQARAAWRAVQKEMPALKTGAARREAARRLGVDYKHYMDVLEKRVQTGTLPVPTVLRQTAVRAVDVRAARLLDDKLLPLSERRAGEHGMRYSMRVMDETARNRATYAARGDLESDVVSVVERWTANNGASVRADLADGSLDRVLDMMESGPEAPTLYRGMSGTSDEFKRLVNGLKAGDEVDLRGIASVTESEDWARLFSVEGGKDDAILFVIKDARGLPIKRISNSPGEEEWLLTGNLEVTKITETVETATGKHVTVEATWKPR